MAADTPAEQLTARLGGRWVEDTFGYCDCPVHGGAGLVVRNGDRSVLVVCNEGCDRRDVIRALRRRGLWEAVPRPVVAKSGARKTANQVHAGNTFLSPRRGDK
jgi:hypothetical protein